MTIVVAFLSIIGLLVLHEFGHFIVAKKFGVKVEEFGVGYPPRIFGKKFGGTIYSLNLIPFGAFVRIPGEGGEKSSLEDFQNFIGKPRWQRLLILLGGVVSFWIVAAILLSIVFNLGVNVAVSDEETNLEKVKVQVLAVSSGSPAEMADLIPGDAIKKIKTAGQFPEEITITKIKEIQDFTEKYKGQEIILTIERGKNLFEKSLTLRISPPKDEGPMGVALARTAFKSYPWWQAPLKGVEATYNLTLGIISGWFEIIKGLIQGQGLPKGVQFVGPIGIGNLIQQAARVGISYFLQFIAMISVYLAIFNILPIPALDGGKLLFLGIEKIKGRPLNQKFEIRITTFFFVLLVILMILVTVKDIIKIF